MFLNILHYRPRNVRLSRYLLFTIRSDWMVNPLTLRPFLAKLAWSFNVAFTGVRPTTGSTLCKNGARFVVAEYRGDQEFQRLLWQHAASWKSIFVCYQCRATSKAGVHCYEDVSDNPGWKETEHNNVSFINQELPPYPCTMIKYCSIFWSVFISFKFIVVAPSTFLWWLARGPLLAVKHWDLFCIKSCSMHCLNLGLVYTANGGVLMPGPTCMHFKIWFTLLTRIASTTSILSCFFLI